MKIILLLSISIVLIACAHGDRIEDENAILYKFKPQLLVHLADRRSGFITKMLDDFEKKCPGKRDNLKDAFIAYNNCTASVDDSKTMCFQVGTYVSKCAKPIQEVADECLSKEVKGVTKFFLELLSTLLKHMCKQDAESVLELINPCIIEYDDDKVIDAMMKFGGTSEENQEKYYHFMRAMSKGRPTPLEICTELASAEKYLESIIKAICKNPKTQQLYVGIYRAVLETPCRSSILKETKN